MLWTVVIADVSEGDSAARGAEVTERRRRQTSTGVVIARRRLLRYIPPHQGLLPDITFNSYSPTTHTRLTALCPGLPGWAGKRKVKPTWILLEQETVSGSGISWADCKSAPRFRQITTPAPHHSVFTGRMPFLPPNQQLQSTEGTIIHQ